MLVGNKIVYHSDVVGASTVSAAPNTSSFSTLHLASMGWEKTTARWDEKHLSFGILCTLYKRFDTIFPFRKILLMFSMMRTPLLSRGFQVHWIHLWHIDAIFENCISSSAENQQSSWCQLYHHWWHWRLSLRQPTVPPVMTKLESWALQPLVPPLMTKLAL